MSCRNIPSAQGHPVHPLTAVLLHTPVRNIPEASAGWSALHLSIKIIHKNISLCFQTETDTLCMFSAVLSTDPEGRGVCESVSSTECHPLWRSRRWVCAYRPQCRMTSYLRRCTPERQTMKHPRNVKHVHVCTSINTHKVRVVTDYICNLNYIIRFQILSSCN